jgi:cytoskeletal protein RodZ
MEERQSNKAGGVGGVVLLFLVGFVGSLVVGWWVFSTASFQPEDPAHPVQSQGARGAGYGL